MLKNYLKKIGLEKLAVHSDKYILNDFVAEAFAAGVPDLSEEEVKKLYIYDVPKVSTDGSCSIIEEKADRPYNLVETFGLQSDWDILKKHPQTIRLWRLRQIVEKLYDEVKVDWFGIYRKVKNSAGDFVLVKEAYKGLFSRAEFPLTKEFAKKSNNTTVGLSGKAVVIQDVAAYTGAYYECDGKVQSEFCLPIFDDNEKVIGILDAEAFPKNHYTDERLLQIAKVAYDLGQKNLGV